MIPQLLLLVLCTLGPEDVDALITTTFRSVDHIRYNSSKDDIDAAFHLVFHLILILPLRLIVAASLYYASALFVKTPIELTSTPIVSPPPQKPDNVAIAAGTIDKPALIVPEPLSPADALSVPNQHRSSSAVRPVETEETILSPAVVPNTLSTNPVVEEMPVLPEKEEEEEDRSTEIPHIVITAAVDQEADRPVLQEEAVDTTMLKVPVMTVNDADLFPRIVRLSAKTPKMGGGIAATAAAAAAASSTADVSADDSSSHHEEEEEASSVESKATSHTSATSSTHYKPEKHAAGPSPIPTPTISQSFKKDRSFSLRISRSARSMRNKISAARQKPEEEQEQLKQKQTKPLRLFPLPSLTKRRPTLKKEKQEDRPMKPQPQPSKTRKRLSALFH